MFWQWTNASLRAVRGIAASLRSRPRDNCVSLASTLAAAMTASACSRAVSINKATNRKLVAISLIFKSERFRVILGQFLHSPVSIYLAGHLGLLAGLAPVLTHNIWSLDWRVIITLMGWIAIVRSVVAIFLPDRIVAVGNAILGHHAAFVIAGAINLLIALLLIYFGFIAS